MSLMVSRWRCMLLCVCSIDDIEDSSDLRRGKPVAHHIYGVPATINCANYVYFLSLQRCHALGNEKAMQVYIREMLKLHQGQGLDIFWRDHWQCPTEHEYLDMVQDSESLLLCVSSEYDAFLIYTNHRVSVYAKIETGGLFRLAVGLMQAFSECTLDFTPLLNALAVYFQIRDDYINLLDEDYMENKSYCEDLTEGKFSFPLILAIRTDLEDTRLMHILKQRTKNVELKKYAVEYMRETGAFERTRAKLDAVVAEIRREIAGLGGNEILECIVTALHSSLK